MKAPKFFFFDCATANALLGRFDIKPSSPEFASALENLVFTHLQAWCQYGPLGREVFYWRSADKVEVDFIVTKNKSP